MDKLYRAIPRMEQCRRLWFTLDELFHLLFLKEIVATVYWFIADAYFRNIA